MPRDDEQGDTSQKIKFDRVDIMGGLENAERGPQFPFRDDLIAAIRKHQLLIIEDDTGSGKIAQVLPKFLREDGFTYKNMKICCTQTRRAAVMCNSARVAQEMGVELGNEVGYCTPARDCTSERTIIKYMIDSTLLRELFTEHSYSYFASYSVLIIDEAHERTLNTDILLGLLAKDIEKFHEDFKLVISTTSQSAEKLKNFFVNAEIFRIPGPRYAVEIYHTKATVVDYIDACVETILEIHTKKPVGDILVFLCDEDEVEIVQEILRERVNNLGSNVSELLILPIYGNLTRDMQAKIFEPSPENVTRRVILATNMAESSLIIDNIIYVIDPGIAQQNNLNARTGMNSLSSVPISIASAKQRASQAGRVAPGQCFRLCTAESFQELKDNTVPEIQRVNLGNAVLLLLKAHSKMSINKLPLADLLDQPPFESLRLALDQLYALGALNSQGEITKLGLEMAEFPFDPKMGKILKNSEKYGCSEEIVTITAMLLVNASIFYRSKDKATDNARKNYYDKHGDHLTLLKVYNKWANSEYSEQWCKINLIHYRSMKRARDVRDRLAKHMEGNGIAMVSSGDSIAIMKTIVSGYFYNIAKLSEDGSYRTLNGNIEVVLDPLSSLAELNSNFVVFHELSESGGKNFIHCLTSIESKWLRDVASHVYKEEDIIDNITTSASSSFFLIG